MVDPSIEEGYYCVNFARVESGGCVGIGAVGLSAATFGVIVEAAAGWQAEFVQSLLGGGAGCSEPWANGGARRARDCGPKG